MLNTCSFGKVVRLMIIYAQSRLFECVCIISMIVSLPCQFFFDGARCCNISHAKKIKLSLSKEVLFFLGHGGQTCKTRKLQSQIENKNKNATVASFSLNTYMQIHVLQIQVCNLMEKIIYTYHFHN